MKALVHTTQVNYGSIAVQNEASTGSKIQKRHRIVLFASTVCALVGGLLYSYVTFPVQALVTLPTPDEQAFVEHWCDWKVTSLSKSKCAATKGGSLRLSLVVQVNKHRFCLHDKRELSVMFRSYNGSLPSTPILVWPGQNLSVVLHNQLGPEGKFFRSENTFRYPNTTSLHIHGIHASPVFEDNVFKTCLPGATVTYKYNIMQKHRRGTFFLHPHFHGSSTLQVGFAMAIPLIVKDTKEEIASSILRTVEDDFALMIGYYEQNTGSGRDFVRESFLSRSSTSLPTSASEANEKERFLWVNGAFNPSLNIRPGLTYRVRLINAAVDGVVNIHFARKVACDFVEIAADGVYYAFGRRRALDLALNSSILVAPGSRKDVLLSCSADVREVQLLSTKSGASSFLGPGTNVLQGPLFRIRLAHERKNSKNAPVPRIGLRTAFARPSDEDLRTSIVEPSSIFILRYNFPGPSTPRYRRDGELYQFYGVNGELYTGDAVVQIQLNRVYEWVIVNDYAMDGSIATESHPFHMHTNHFQVISVTNPALEVNGDFRLGDYRDTVSVPPGGNVTIRFRPRDFTGTSLAHCHIFTHSDTGMMVAFDIIKAWKSG